jgi:hypothetical protein
MFSNGGISSFVAFVALVGVASATVAQGEIEPGHPDISPTSSNMT